MSLSEQMKDRITYDEPVSDEEIEDWANELAQLEVELQDAKIDKSNAERLRDNTLAENEVSRNALATAQVFAIELKAESDVLKDAITPVMAGAHGKECPHGINPFYPTHPWWCDECFQKIDDLLTGDDDEDNS